MRAVLLVRLGMGLDCWRSEGTWYCVEGEARYVFHDDRHLGQNLRRLTFRGVLSIVEYSKFAHWTVGRKPVSEGEELP